MSSFDFSKVEAAANKTFIRPGMYRLTPTEVTLETPQDKNPRLTVVFTRKDGSNLKERFIITPKALSRLQYLHEAWFSKKLEKAFTSVEQLGEYFKKALLTKAKDMPMIVGGEEAQDGKVYARLPFTGFVVLREDLFEEGEFEVGSARYNEVVKKSTLASAALATDDAVLPDTSSNTTTTDDSEMPW